LLLKQENPEPQRRKGAKGTQRKTLEMELSMQLVWMSTWKYGNQAAVGGSVDPEIRSPLTLFCLAFLCVPFAPLRLCGYF
jgi:hypothetical protein